jgi:predicted Rossmann fold nucleotide-binding protein DprA/Smf involved in DNA uptake
VLVDEPEQVLEALGASVAQVSSRLRRAVQPKALDHGDLFSHAVTALPRPDQGPEALVAKALHEASSGFDELLTRTGLTSATLAPILLGMELDGRLKQQHGVYLPCGSAPHTRAGLQRRR